MSRKVAVFGSINMDQVARVERFPRPGETLKAKGFERIPGGKGANQAVAASRLGAEVSMFGLVGEDGVGEELVSNLEADRVVTDFVERRPGSSGLALIQVDDPGENQIVIIPGANGKLDESYVDSNLAAILEGEVLLLQLEVPFSTTAYLLDRLSSVNGEVPTVVLDPAPARDLTELDLSAVDYLTPNEGEVERLLPAEGREELVSEVLSRGVEALVVTRGEAGSTYVSEETAFAVPGFPVDVRDTTAAGDAFAGALAVGLTREVGIREVLEFANAAGGLAAAGEGAQPSLPERKRVEDFLDESADGDRQTGGGTR